jgi:transcriptional regulator with PAS, ATPase and Fis domain
MAVAGIQFIAPTSEIALRAASIAREMGIKEQFDCHVANLAKGLELAIRLEEQGAEVFVARRGTGAMIQRALRTPLVYIPVTLEDMVQALAKARRLTGLSRPKVAFFGMPHQDGEMNMFADLLNFELHLYHVLEQEELLAAAVVAAIAEGANVIVGGAVVTQMAWEQDVAAVLLDSGHVSLREALNEAKGLAYARTLEKSQNERFRAVVDSSNDGVLVLDESKRLQMVNPAALKILGKSTIPLGAVVDAVLPGLDVSACYAGQTIRNVVVDSPRGTLLLSMVPTRIGEITQGAVLSFIPVESIAELGAVIHKTKNARGFVSQYSFDDIVGVSPQIAEAKEKARQYAAGKVPILLAGETGTGKELFAHAVHRASPYSQGPFVTVNCASLPPTLLESELFGYEEGAFTGAVRSGKPGFFELAHKGSIFLDEISELDLHAQIRLLRVVQEQTTMRIGGNRMIPLDVRVIAATNRNLWDMVGQGSFRKDLFFRLSVLPVFIPPLRDRAGDVECLIAYALSRLGEANKPAPNQNALKQLKAYNWPGNVRELLNMVERYAMDSTNSSRHDPAATFFLHPELQWVAVMDLDSAPKPEQLGRTDERTRIAKALEENGWHQTRTAAHLGMDRTTLYRKMRIHGLRKYA